MLTLNPSGLGGDPRPGTNRILSAAGAECYCSFPFQNIRSGVGYVVPAAATAPTSLGLRSVQALGFLSPFVGGLGQRLEQVIRDDHSEYKRDEQERILLKQAHVPYPQNPWPGCAPIMARDLKVVK